MNSSAYLFGKLNQGYTQYPNDYAQSIFQEFASKSMAKAQIIIHRENNLMYYGYVRLLDGKQSQYLGMCITINGLMITDIKSLFDLFENTLTSIVANGDILKLDENGNVTSNIVHVSEQKNETERILNLLQNSVASLDDKSDKLPPISYGISSSEVKKFTISDPVKDIIDASHKYSYTIIYKDSDYETNTLKGYKGVIIRLRNEKNELNEKLQKLSVDYNKVLREKKRSTLVSILCACIILFMIIGYTVVQKKDNIISEKNTTIINKESKIADLNYHADNLRQSIVTKDRSILEKENIISDQNSEIEKLNNSIYNKEYQIEDLNRTIYNLRADLSNKISEISTLKSTIYELKSELRLKNSKDKKLSTSKNTSTQSLQTVQNKNHQNGGYYVKIYTSVPVLSQPYLNAKEICRAYDKVLILYKANEKFYRVKYGNTEGYLWKEWIHE